jgi:hypothetical protein
VENKREYIERLKMVAEQLHNCSAEFLYSIPIKEEFEGQTVWEGDVEYFHISGHPKANYCYGWSYGEPEQFITILELPPVGSADDAVKVGVAYQIRKGKV